MATPLGHSIVGYLLARLAGVQSPEGVAAAVGVANLPDVDFLLGYVANGDARSLHHEVITHRPVFPLIVGVAAGLTAAGVSLLRGRRPTPRQVLQPAALAAALVSSHVAMDPLPLPYEPQWSGQTDVWHLVTAHAWNTVIDFAFYGLLATLLLSRADSAARKAG